jgi:toxin ParE1/3/4
MGAPIEVGGHGFRRIGVRGFPYHLAYRLTDDEVQVLAVAHDRRRPDYWIPRSTDS